MSEIFDRYRKAIITGGGVAVFLIAGLLTMIFTDSDSSSNTSSGNEPPSQKSQLSESSANPKNDMLASESQSSKTTQPSKILYVYITGEIKKPGVYKLSEDSRIFQLIETAGGFTSKADTESLNLAETMTDGLHIHIGAKIREDSHQAKIPGMPEYSQPQITASETVRNSAVSPSRTQAGTQAGRVNVNTAGAAELESLPGIGPALAQRIIDYRSRNGNFSRPEDLINVRGIGQSKLSQILPYVMAMNTGGGSGTRITQPKSSHSSSGLIDINSAGQKELERLPGVGPVTAKRIIEYRNTHGRFSQPEDLINIRGISRAKLDNMRSMITVR